MENTDQNPKLSVILPCRNEEKAIGECLRKIREVLAKNNINGEIIVSDSSGDNSPVIAKELGAIVVKHGREGYGFACLEGFRAAKGKYLFLADADGSYDFAEIPRFLAYLENGYDFVIGDRFKGKIAGGAMPFLHRYFGSPFLSSLLGIFFHTEINDIHCGMRALTKETLAKLKLSTIGMEFASEMVIKAAKNKLKIKELPINYYKRTGTSKMKSFADGWRHLRFMLLYSPLYLFFIPGLTLLLAGVVTMALLYFDRLSLFGVRLYYHPMFLSALLIIVGYQLIVFAAFAKTYAITHLGEKDRIMEYLYSIINIEKAGLFGVAILALGAFIYIKIFLGWISSGLGNLVEIKNSILALTLIILSIQTIFSAFMLSILGIKEK